MENFMRVASRTDDSVMFLDEETVVGKEGKRVEIVDWSVIAARYDG